MHPSSPFLHPQRVRNCYAPPITHHKGYCHTLSPTDRICSWQLAGASVRAFYGVAPIAGQSTLLQLHTSLQRSTSTEIWHLQRKRVIFICSRGINRCNGQLNQKNAKRGEEMSQYVLKLSHCGDCRCPQKKQAMSPNVSDFNVRQFQ